jgi:chemotaxis protein methyltransferase CheR
MEVSDVASRILAGLLEARTGQQLTVSRRWRLESALQPLMRERGLGSLDDLITTLIAEREPGLSDRVVEALLNNETFFFRDRASFDLLLRGALPRLQRAREKERRLSIWCAGCSTGQEAYSLAMSFAEDRLRWQGWKIDILATDVSGSAIAQAQEGLYSQFEVQRGLAVRQMMRWFEEEAGQQWRISRELRGAVGFKIHSLTDAVPQGGPFDIVLCRNVLLYFAPAVQITVFAKLAEAAAPDAALMLGAGETIIGQTDEFVPDPENRGLYIRSAASAPKIRAAAG